MTKKACRDLRKYLPYAFQSAEAKLKAEVAGSYLNWLWLIINPLSFMLIYTFIFGVVFRAAEPYFPLYVFIGLTMWDFFSHSVINSVSMIKKNRDLLRKIYIPKFILVLSELIHNALKMGISLGVVFFMMLLYRIPISVGMLYLIPLLIGMFLLTFGISNLIMHLGVYIQDLTSVVNIVLRLMFYFTGIFYDIGKRIPVPYSTLLLRINPMATFLKLARTSLIYGHAEQPEILCIWFLISAVIAGASIYIIYRSENSYVKVI